VSETKTVTSTDPYAGFQPKGGASPGASGDPVAIQLYEASDDDRREIAQLLKNAGYRVDVNGKYSDKLVQSYSDAVQKAAIQSQRLGRGFSVREYLLQETPAEVATNGAGDTSVTNYISDETQAAGTVQAVFQGLLGRDATTKEVTALSKILVDAQKKNPYKTVNGVRTGGMDDKQFLVDLIQTGTYEGNKKAFPGILKNLAEEAKTKKTGAEEKVRLTNEQEILNTSMNNGVKLSPSQVKSYVDGIKAGKSLEQAQQEIRNIAALGMPDGIKKMIEAGTDLDAIYSPYKRTMAASLDINADTIDLNDPTLRQAIGPDKEMSLYDFKKAIRKDKRWKYSEEANNEVDEMIGQVKRDFGFMG
jgi:hypothetical protein